MRLLIALRDAGQAALLRHEMLRLEPGAQVLLREKRELSATTRGDGAPADAIIAAYPWISLATLVALRRRSAATALLACAPCDARVHRTLLAHGVAAIVADDALPAIVVAALRIALDNGVTVQARCLREVDESPPAPTRRRIHELNLTPRQGDVLRLIADGRSNHDIADTLGLGVRTVKGHVAVILRALHADNRHDARRTARRWLARTDGTAPVDRVGTVLDDSKAESVSPALGTGR